MLNDTFAGPQKGLMHAETQWQRRTVFCRCHKCIVSPGRQYKETFKGTKPCETQKAKGTEELKGKLKKMAPHVASNTKSLLLTRLL